MFFRSGEDIYANIDTLMNTVGPREEPVGAAGSSALTKHDSEEAADPAADRQVEDCDVLYTTVNWKKKSKKKDI